MSLTIDNTNGGHIGQDAIIALTTANNLDAGSLNVLINNRDGGSIGSSAQVLCSTLGTLNVQDNAAIGISNRNDGGGGGTTGTDAIVTVQADSISVGGELDGFVSANGGHIGNIGALLFNVTGDLHSGAGMFFETQATAFNGSGGSLTPGFIGSDALVGVNAGGNITSDGFIGGDILTTNGGHIVGNASLLLNATGDINGTQGIAGVISLFGGGQIDASAQVGLNAQNIITASTATGTPGTDTMALEASIYSNVNGKIGNDAIVAVAASQNISAPGTVFFAVANGNAGTIGGNAKIDVTATNISTGDFLPQIFNSGGASIGGHAEIDVSATSLVVTGALTTLINNSQSGAIGSDATIDFSVSGNTTVASNATFEIFGSDGAQSAAININGGNYSVAKGTFLGSIDGSGTITFNNASVHANVLQVGALGTNGVLNIGGGTLSADTTLKLYAGGNSGNSGAINFTADVTLWRQQRKDSGSQFGHHFQQYHGHDRRPKSGRCLHQQRELCPLRRRQRLD